MQRTSLSLSIFHGMRISSLFGLIAAASAFLGPLAAVAEDASPRSPIVIAIQTDGMSGVEREFIAKSEDYLTYALPDRPIVFQHLSFEDIQHLTEERRVDFVLTSPDNYVVLERFFGARSLVSHQIREAASPDTSTGVVVAVRRDDPSLRSLNDLTGQTVLTPSRNETLHRIFDRELVHAGVKNVRTLTLLSSDDAPETAVLNRVADGTVRAAIVPSCLFERESARHPERFANIRFLTTDRTTVTRCLSSTVFYPGWTLASFPEASPLLNQLIAGTLLGMPTDAVGGDWKTGARYNSLHELLETLGDANYQRQSQLTWETFIRKYGVLLAFLGLSILGMIIHSIRAAVLVRRRTDELMKTVEEKQRIEEEAKRYNERLVAIERVGLVGELSSMIAHEVKQPLAVIRNYTRGLNRALAHDNLDPAMLRTALGKIDSQSTKASDIIDHVRSFAKHTNTAVTPICLTDVLKQAVAAFVAARQTPTVCDAEPDLWVEADALEMELLINNLLKNAADAVSVEPDGAIAASLTLEDGRVLLTIRDNGPRLTDEQFAKLTVPLNSSKPQGLGLGLVIVRRIAESACGSVLFTRLPERGLSITVSLPHYNNTMTEVPDAR